MADGIEPCIQSVLKQSNSNYELILVNDGSTDDSGKIITEYADKYPDVIKAVHQENQGSGFARNAGISVANGEYYLFIDADDLLDDHAVEILLDQVARHDQPDLIVFGYNWVQADGKNNAKVYDNASFDGDDVRQNYERYFSQTFRWGIQGAPWNKLFKADVVKNHNVEYPSLRRHQDEVFICRYVAHTKNVIFVDSVLYTHFANDMKLFYQKYPSYYYDIVCQLFEFRKKIVETWNPNNEALKAEVYSEYINNVIRSAFRAFNPEEGCKGVFDRIRWYKTHFVHVEIRKCRYPREYISYSKSLQNKLIVFSLKNKCYVLFDMIVKIRISKIK